MKSTKRIAAIIIVFAIVLSSFSGCGFRKKTEQVEELSTGVNAADMSGAPFFKLSDLPDIGAYTFKSPYSRWYAEYTPVFKPSDEYGDLLIYIGDTRVYQTKESESMSETISHYGLMTLGGKVVVDPVYSYAYTRALDNDKSVFVLGQQVSNNTDDVSEIIVAPDGSWQIKLEGYWLVSTDNDRIIVRNENNVKGFDYEGKAVFSLKNCELVGDLNDGIIVCRSMVAESGEMPITEPTTAKINQPTTRADKITTPVPTAPRSTQPTSPPTAGTTAHTEAQATVPQVTHTTQPATEPTTLPTTKAPATAKPSSTVAPVGAGTVKPLAYVPSAAAVKPMAATQQKVERFLCYDEDGNLLGFPQFIYCEGFANGYAVASTQSGTGVISATGTWLINPTYKSVQSVEGKYFIVNDGKKMEICDANLGVIKSGTTASMSNKSYTLCGDTLIYDTAEGFYCNALTDKPISCSNGKVKAKYTLWDLGLFYSFDAAGNGIIFSADGQILNTIAKASSIYSLNDEYYVVEFGLEVTDKFEIYTASTNRKIFEWANDKSEGFCSLSSYEDIKNYVSMYNYTDDRSALASKYDIINLKSGKYLFKDCLEANVQYISGRYYFRVAYAGYTAVYNEQMKLLIKINNSYTD